MTKRNPSRRRSRKKELKKKITPPIGMIAVGVGIVLIGLVALFTMPEKNADPGVEEEYSAIPMPVDYDAPPLALTDLTEEEVALTDYRDQVVLVNLWATWCPPCKAELPVLQEFYADHKAEGFVIIGIDSQEKSEVVENYIKTTNVRYPIWVDLKGDASLAFNSYTLPSSFVIDRSGKVRLAWTGAISKSMLEKHVTPIIQE
jgi:thiol-disulfide isomerase/thioredoxin